MLPLPPGGGRGARRGLLYSRRSRGPAVPCGRGRGHREDKLLGESRSRVEENQGTEALPGEQSSNGCTREASSHMPELSEALPGAALNKDQLNKAGALARGGGSRSRAAAAGYRARKPGSSRPEDAGGRKGAATWFTPALGKAMTSSRIPSPCSGATTIGNAKCWLRESRGFTPCCHISRASLEAN